MLRSILLNGVVDPHAHFRGRPMANLVVPFTTVYCMATLGMPNTPRLLSWEHVTEYNAMLRALAEANKHHCDFIECIMLDQVTDTPTTPDTIRDAKRTGTKVGKIYFIGTTTGSHAAGIIDIYKLGDVLKAMEECGMILAIHLELPPPHYFQDRERDAVYILLWIVKNFPQLKISVEHITTARLVDMILSLPDHVTGNITSHHLYDTLDIVNGGFLNPHGHCKPPHPTPDDRVALRLAAISGNPKFRAGSDTAPHGKNVKECSEGCAGCFTAPFVLSMQAEIFAKYLPAPLVQPRMQEFNSDRAVEFYDLKRFDKPVELVRKRCDVPAIYQYPEQQVGLPDENCVDLVPYRAGHSYDWSMRLR